MAEFLNVLLGTRNKQSKDDLKNIIVHQNRELKNLETLVQVVIDDIEVNSYPCLKDAWSRNKNESQFVTTVNKMLCITKYIKAVHNYLSEQKTIMKETANVLDQTLAHQKNSEEKHQLLKAQQSNSHNFPLETPYQRPNLELEDVEMAECSHNEEIYVAYNHNHDQTQETDNFGNTLKTVQRRLTDTSMKARALHLKENRLKQNLIHIHEQLDSTIDTNDSAIIMFDSKLKDLSDVIEKHCKEYSSKSIQEDSLRSKNQEIFGVIDKLEEEVMFYEKKIEQFQGTTSDKEYLHIHEMLIRILEKLDKIDSQKRNEIIEERKRVIGFVKQLLSSLRDKATN